MRLAFVLFWQKDNAVGNGYFVDLYIRPQIIHNEGRR